MQILQLVAGGSQAGHVKSPVSIGVNTSMALWIPRAGTC